MKKLLPAFLMLLLFSAACKKNQTDKSKFDPKAPNHEVVITATGTYDIKIVQRQNSNLVYYTLVDKPGTSGNYSFKFYGEVNDLLQLTLKNTGGAPMSYKVLFNDTNVIREESDSPPTTRFNGTVDMYLW